MNAATYEQRRYDRLRRTRTLAGDGFERWRHALIGIVGAGLLGGRTASEIVMSGASVRLYDPQVGAIENAGTQSWIQPGVPKVETVAAHCNSIRPAAAIARQADIRQIGVGEIAQCDLLIDCSDAPALTVPLTRLTNGIGMPMLRGALAGDGKSEMGRVQCSHGGRGHSCAMCTYSAADIFRGVENTPCVLTAPERPPTLAGGAMGAMIAGALTISAQRLVSENDIEQVLDRECILDMTGGQLLPLVRRRSERCISGHQRWELTAVPLDAAHATFADVLDIAQERAGGTVATVQPFAHPLCTEATCPCGMHAHAVGTRWATPPTCADCGIAMTWRRTAAKAALTPEEIHSLNLNDQPLAQLGLPARGAMFTVCLTDGRAMRLVLE